MGERVSYIPAPDEIIASRLQPEKLKVSGDGVFFTLQGEGVNIGQPAVFLRLHLCNLQCTWCDTPYTWNRSLPEYWQESQDWDIGRTVTEISKFDVNRLVITGGEPMMQQAAISRLTTQIPDWDIEIETNGTIAPITELAQRCQFNVSPKLKNSVNIERIRLRLKALQAFNALDRTTFKFVVQTIDDIAEIDQIIKAISLDPRKIIIMPEGKSDAEIRQHALDVVELVKGRGWRLLPRLHVMLWKNQRGI